PSCALCARSAKGPSAFDRRCSPYDRLTSLPTGSTCIGASRPVADRVRFLSCGIRRQDASGPFCLMTSDVLVVATRPAVPDDLPAIVALQSRAFSPGRFARTAYRVREAAPDLSPYCRVAL